MRLLPSWYCVHHARLLRTDMTYSFSLFGEALVIFRSATGRPVCIKDLCPHRGVPLSSGIVVQGEIECPYHGARFGIDEGCTAGDRIPCKYIVDERYSDYAQSIVAWSYPCVEQQGYLWVYYTGQATQEPIPAPIEEIPADPYYDDPQWTYQENTADLESEWSFVVENHLDALHLFYVHSGVLSPTISRKHLRRFEVEFHREERDRDVARQVLRSADGAEFITLQIAAPGRVLQFNATALAAGKKMTRVQVLDHVPLTRTQTRILIRHYVRKGNPATYLPDLFSLLGWKIFSQDHRIMKEATNLALLDGPPPKKYLLKEDKLIAHYRSWLKRQEEEFQPWKTGRSAVSGAVSLLQGGEQEKIQLRYPPARMAAYHTLRLRMLATGLGAIFVFLAAFFELLGFVRH